MARLTENGLIARLRWVPVGDTLRDNTPKRDNCGFLYIRGLRRLCLRFKQSAMSNSLLDGRLTDRYLGIPVKEKEGSA